jgi:hypothetical protein
VVVTLGAAISLLVPNIPAEHEVAESNWADTADTDTADTADTDPETEPEPSPA